MAERLTDAEIIKGLECCSKNSILQEYCDVCPNLAMGSKCMDNMVRDALDLINRQKAEIKKWKGAAKLWHTMMQKEMFRQDIIRADAIKEVFDKLKERLFVHSFKTKSEDYTQGQVDCMDFVDSKIEELKKELVGDSDG